MSQSEPETSVYEEAAAWVLRLGDDVATPGASQEFEAWRDQSPLHAQALSEARAAWDLLGEQATSPELLTLRRDALDRARRVGRGRWAGPALSRRALAAGIAASIATPAAVYGWFRLRSPAEEMFETAHGEQRTIVLTDGSRMSMDARTQVKVAFSSRLRAIYLIAGRANFEVAKDPERPLRVRADGRTVTAIGTAFTVERAADAVVVTLVEGRVVVGRGDARPISMAAGQQLTLADTGAASLRESIDGEQALAWREGKLIFDDEPLPAAASRMNNYGSPEIVVEGPARGLKISGVFKAGETDAFVEAVESYFPVEAARTGPTIILRLRAQVRQDRG